MSDLDYKLRCPFCNEELLFWGATGPWRKCPKCDNNLLGNDELWQELITTRKALDIAVDALKELRPTEKRYCYLVPTVFTTQRTIDEALKQINEIKGK